MRNRGVSPGLEPSEFMFVLPKQYNLPTLDSAKICGEIPLDATKFSLRWCCRVVPKRCRSNSTRVLVVSTVSAAKSIDTWHSTTV